MILVGFLLLVAVPEHDAGYEQAPRASIGAAAGLSQGFQLGGSFPVRGWHHGELAVGILFATRFNFLQDPRRKQSGFDLSGADATIDLAPTFGHDFRLARRRMHLGLHVYAGLGLRTQRTRLQDPEHDIDTRYVHTAAYGLLGTLVTVGARLGRAWGLDLTGAIPWVVTGQAALGHTWLVDSPYVALSLARYF